LLHLLELLLWEDGCHCTLQIILVVSWAASRQPHAHLFALALQLFGRRSSKADPRQPIPTQAKHTCKNGRHLGSPKRIPGSSPQKKSRVRGSWGSVARRPERRSQRVIVGDPTRHPVSAAPSPCEHWPVPQHTPSPIPSPTVFSSHIQFLLLFVSMTSSSCPAPLPKPKAGQGLVPLCGVALLANVTGPAGFRFRFRFR
jgi:hypothetical protein